MFKPELLSDLPWEQRFNLLLSIAPARTINSLGWKSPTCVDHTVEQLDFRKPFPQQVTDMWMKIWTVLECGCFHTGVKAHCMYCTKHGGDMLCFLNTSQAE